MSVSIGYFMGVKTSGTIKHPSRTCGILGSDFMLNKLLLFTDLIYCAFFFIVKCSLVSGSGYFSYHEELSLIVNPHTGIPAFKPVFSKFGKIEIKNVLAHRYMNIFSFPQ